MISVHARESVASVIRGDQKLFVALLVCSSTRDKAHTHWYRLATYDRNLYADPTEAKKALEKLLSLGAVTKMDTHFNGGQFAKAPNPWRDDYSRYAPTQLGIDALRLVYSTRA